MAGAVSPAGSVQFIPTPGIDYAVSVLQGEQIRTFIPQIIALYLEAFKEPPYSCEDSFEYQPFLELYAQNNGIACVSFHEDKLIGAATGVPLKCMPERFTKPFETQLETMFYLGEEVVHKDHRGKSLGTRLYEAFEQEVPRQFDIICFCELIKPAPSLDPVKGFYEQRNKTFEGIWKDVGAQEATPHTMVYWTKQR